VAKIPNWCYSSVEIKGDVKNIKKFLKLFLWDNREIKEGVKYFARSFTQNDYREFIKENFKKTDKGEIEIYLLVEFAWSCHSCLIEGYPNENNDCITLIDACKKYKVDVKIESAEEGLGFEEEITCDREGNLTEDCIDMPTIICKCGNEQLKPSYMDISEIDCYECGECDKWEN
jgi:hypothetical protein